MKLVDMKPCPFCGGYNLNPVMIREDADSDIEHPTGDYVIKCDGCLTRGPEEHGKTKACEAWNRRYW